MKQVDNILMGYNRQSCVLAGTVLQCIVIAQVDRTVRVETVVAILVSVPHHRVTYGHLSSVDECRK